MIEAAHPCGGRSYLVVQIITVEDLVEDKRPKQPTQLH
jgi:hypothetical protein